MTLGRLTFHRAAVAVMAVAVAGIVVLACTRTGAADAAKRASHRTVLVRLNEITTRVKPRQLAVVSARVGHHAVCALTLRQHARRAGPFKAMVSARYAAWSWRVPARVHGGRWRVAVRCRHGDRARTAHGSIRVRGGGHSGAIATRRAMTMSVSNRPPAGRAGSGPQSGLLGGKGGGNVCADPAQPGSVLDAGGYCTGNCTHWVWQHRPDLTYLGDAGDWKANAARRGIPTGSRPVVGAVAWWPRVGSGVQRFGHVAYVESVSGDRFTVSEMNHLGYNRTDTRTFTVGQAGGPPGFIYGGRAGNGPSAGPPAQPTPAPTTAPAPAPTATPTPTVAPPVAPRTWSEQETPNHPVNTFRNYHNASGAGPAVAAGMWVQVSCKVHDATIASVNPDGYWYRIASSPWNSAYYAPANTFMNGDPYGGPYTHNTDFAVPDC